MKNNVYEMVTNRIIDMLEQGIIPWTKPWAGTRSGAFNRITKKPYSLLNQMMLKHDGEYATFKQWTDLGGKVRKGEKSEIIVFWKIQNIVELNEDGEEERKQIPLLRYYNVFHVSQVDGIEPLPEEETTTTLEPIEEVDKILMDYITREGIKLVNEKSNDAYYSPSRDLIHLPLLEQFKSVEEYYSTFAHESVHSTMKESRCNRMEENKRVSFGSTDYSKEELVAEIGAANILNMLNIETSNSFKNNTAYIQSWLAVLKNDVKFIVSASSKAEKATKYILNICDVEGTE